MFLGNAGPPMPRCVTIWPSLRIGMVRVGLAGLVARNNIIDQTSISYIDNGHTDPKFLRIQQRGVCGCIAAFVSWHEQVARGTLALVSCLLPHAMVPNPDVIKK